MQVAPENTFFTYFDCKYYFCWGLVLVALMGLISTKEWFLGSVKKEH